MSVFYHLKSSGNKTISIARYQAKSGTCVKKKYRSVHIKSNASNKEIMNKNYFPIKSTLSETYLETLKSLETRMRSLARDPQQMEFVDLLVRMAQRDAESTHFFALWFYKYSALFNYRNGCCFGRCTSRPPDTTARKFFAENSEIRTSGWQTHKWRAFR